MTLVQIRQDDFAVGMLQGVARDVQPGVGVSQILNGLLNDDGDVYRRGGSVEFAPPFIDPMRAAFPVTWIWSGYLSGKQYIFYTTETGLYSVNAIGDGQPAGMLSPDAGLFRPANVAVVAESVFLANGYRVHADAAGVLDVAAWPRPASLDVAGPLHLATCAGRLVVACANRIAFSAPEDPTLFDPTDFHDLPGGAIVRGLAPIDDTLLVFTNFGLWVITNMAFNLTDAAGNIQQTLSLLSPDMALIHESGLAPWAGSYVAPCIDRVYLVNASSAPVPISDSIVPLHMGHATAGHQPGQARIYRNTLFLPWLRKNMTGGWQWDATYTCRLHRPVRGRYLYYPWTELTGYAAQTFAYDVYVGQVPMLLSGNATDGRIENQTGFFAPDDLNTHDADGSAFEFEIETRDFPTGQGQPNHLKRIRLGYTLRGAAQITAEYNSDPALALWTALPIADLIAPGLDPVSWWLPTAARVRYVRVRFRSIDAAAIVAHFVVLETRPAAHAR